MATKTTKKKGKGKKKGLVGDTPITIGGGGGSVNPKVSVPLTINYVAADWQQSTPPGTLTLRGGKFKRIKISEGGSLIIDLPLTGAITIDLTCGKP